MNTILKNELFRRFISILFLILIWEIISRIIGDKIILPSPSDVAESIKYHASKDLFHHVYITLLRVFTAFFLAMIIGSVIGIVMGRKKKIDDYLDGWLILALNVPALVTIILCFIWFGLNEVAAVLAVAINKIPTVTVILREGTKAIDEKLIEVGKVYKMSKFDITKDKLTDKFNDLATSVISLSFFGKNSCNGGSNSLTVTGRPFIILNISIKSFF